METETNKIVVADKVACGVDVLFVLQISAVRLAIQLVVLARHQTVPKSFIASA